MGNLTDIYSTANIARSKARAAHIRARVAIGQLEPEWLISAAEIETYANEREALAAYSAPVDPASLNDCEACQ